MLLFLLALISGDDELVTKCRVGNAEAFDELISKWQDKIYSYAFRMIKNEDDAADITQDVFIKFYNTLPNYREQCSLKTWLFTLASNEVKNFWNSKVYKKGRATNSMDEHEKDENRNVMQIPSDNPSPRVSASENEFVLHLETQLAALKEESREVLLLCFKEQLSYEEIANVLTINIGTVKSRIARAREELKYRMERYLQ